ncbi:MAG: hypothetical protein KAS32_11490 [Candidatus Peribacteraceae bacterium]|nr:hypothetical protein [Candidatus Peribacteraceae bacterium]
MKPRDIIAKAWTLTKKGKQIRRWGFLHSFFRTLLNAKLFFFQSWLAYSYFILKDPIGFGEMETVLWHNTPHWFSISIIVLFLTLLVVELLFPHMARGAIIGLAAKSYKKEEVKGGLVLAIYNFFPLFAVHEILVLSGITTTITLCSLSLRYGGVAGPIACIILLSIWIVSTIIEFFWIFTEEAIVIRKIGIGKAIRQSVKLVLSYLGHVVFLLLLLFVIILRIVANLLMLILVPAIVLAFGLLFASFMPPFISYTISSLLGIVIIFFASYLLAYLEVFRQTVWTITYMELCKEKELDIIDIESAITPTEENEVDA